MEEQLSMEEQPSATIREQSGKGPLDKWMVSVHSCVENTVLPCFQLFLNRSYGRGYHLSFGLNLCSRAQRTAADHHY